MDLSIIGGGRVGSALAANAVRRGLEVELLVRDPATIDAVSGARVTALEDAPVERRTAILAIPFGAVDQVVATLPLAPGSILIDATNPFGQPVPSPWPSGAALVESLAPQGVQVAKAFNVLGSEHMVDPALDDGWSPVLPVAANDEGARTTVVELASLLGFDAVAVGDLSAAGTLEEAARYWGLLAFTGGRGREVVLVAHQRSGS